MAPRATLIQLIQDIKKDVVQMADLALANIKEGIEAFKSNDQELAKAVMAKDEEVDQFEENIAKSALRIIWREQPVAGDLRLVTGILKLITDLERIGDHASDIAEMTRHLKNKRNKLVMPIASKMAEIIEKMVLTSVEALVNVDIERAQSVIDMDDEVDDLFDEAVKKITSELKYDKIDANDAIYIMMVAKYIERVGDHAVNIAEWIIFIDTGTHKDTILF
jgi:phosphate transport system protein